MVKKVTIANIHFISTPDTTVYNFEVEDTHSYFVGKDKVWVHNYSPSILNLSEGKRIDALQKKKQMFEDGKNQVEVGEIQEYKIKMDKNKDKGGFFEKIVNLVKGNGFKTNYNLTHLENTKKLIEHMNMLTDTILFEADEDGNISYKKLTNIEETKKSSKQLLENTLFDKRRRINIEPVSGVPKDEDKNTSQFNRISTVRINVDVDQGKRFVIKDDEGFTEEYSPEPAIDLSHELIHVYRSGKDYDKYISGVNGKVDSLTMFYKNLPNTLDLVMNRILYDFIGPERKDGSPRKVYRRIVKAEEIFTISNSSKEIKIYDLNGKPIKYPESSYQNRNDITENDIRKEHNLPIRINYQSGNDPEEIEDIKKIEAKTGLKVNENYYR
ncbi:MAG: hypothetical protein SFU98_16725 [Leptospiraceae bacterium]|nr:hypothetical protein [Leptospiraceae bacterium]